MATKSFPRGLTVVGGTSRHDVNDRDLVAGLVGGHVWAQARAWERFAPIVFGMAVRTLGSEPDAEDVMQEALYRVFTKIRSLRDPDALHAFVVSFAIRILKWELRKRHARRWLSFREPEALIDQAWTTPDLESRELLQRFYAHLSRLQPEARLVYSLRHLESMTFEQITEVMKTSRSTAKRLHARAVMRMQGWAKADVELSALLATKGPLDASDPG